MGFFSDLKDDLSQAVNELKPEENIGAAGEKISESADIQKTLEGIITSEELSDMLDKVEAMSAEVPVEPLMMDETLLTQEFQSEVPLEESLEVLPEESVEPLMMDETLLTEEVPLVEPLMMDESLPEISLDALNETQLVDVTEETELTDAQEELLDKIQVDESEVIQVPATEELQVMEEFPATEEFPVTEEFPNEEIQNIEEIQLTEEMQVEIPEETVSIEGTDMSIEAENELREGVQEGMSEEVMEEVLTTNDVEQVQEGEETKMDMQPKVATDETAVVTEGMSIIGDITSGGSLELLGSVTGNIEVLGKLNITGSVQGNSKAAEIFAEGARINGEINSQGSVKIGQSSVIIGNIFANSAVIAGAVKGDIDIHGPVVLDTSAIVMGNIKSKSVQINNGAVIEGMCSQCYAEVNPTSFFDEIKKKKDKK